MNRKIQSPALRTRPAETKLLQKTPVKLKRSQEKISVFDRPRTSSTCRGMTLVEILIVIAVILVLASLLLTKMSSIQGSLARTSCLAKLRDLSAAIALYGSENNNRFPGFGAGPTGRWLHQVAPYLGRPADGNQQGIPVSMNAYNFKEFVCPARSMWKNPLPAVSPGIYGINPNLIGGASPGTPSSGPMTGVSRAAVSRPSSTVLLGDKCDGSPALRISGSTPWFPIDQSGAAANHRSDLSPANGPQGAQNYLFVDGHAETRDAFPGLGAFALDNP